MSIKTLSPHYVYIPLTNAATGVVCGSYTLKVYIWDGLRTAPPDEATYEVTKINAAGFAGTEKVNISRIVNDYIEFTFAPQFTTDDFNGDNQVWVKREVYYDDEPDTPRLADTQLSVKGYGYFTEGENPQLPTRLLLAGNEFKVSRSSFFVVPVLINEGGLAYNVTVRSYPGNQISSTINIGSAGGYSNATVRYIWVNISQATTDEYITITMPGVGLSPNIRRTLYITDECRYTPVDVAFQNKHGAIQLFTFFKARKNTLSFERERFESNRAIGEHQFINYGINTKEKVSINTGFITEDKNEVVQQLLMSERVWLFEGGQKVPVNIADTSHELKTRQNDRLINYAIDFEYAFYKNNTV